MDRFEAMRVLVAVVDAGSLSAGGRELGMPLATVSRKISDLEDELKTRLLIRSTRQLTLTDVGEAYLAACRRILEDVGEAQRAVRGEYTAPRGDLVMTAPVVFGRLHLLPVVVEFLRVYPDIRVRLALSDRTVNLLEDHVDVALRIGALTDSSLVTTTLGTIRRLTCATPAYLAAHGIPEHPKDLGAHTCVSFEFMGSINSWQFHDDGAELAVQIHPQLIVGTAEAAVDAALLGAGITRVLSYQVETPLHTGTLHRLLRPFEGPAIPVQFLYARQGRVPLKLRALLDFAAPRLRARLQKAQDALEVTAAKMPGKGPRTGTRAQRG